MSSPRPGSAGATRGCPHCKTVILESASVCPACRHHLRYEAGTDIGASTSAPAVIPLRVEGSIRHPREGGAWEYCVVVSIRNDRGEEIGRQVVGVGALQADEERSFSLTVEMTPASARSGKKNTRH